MSEYILEYLDVNKIGPLSMLNMRGKKWDSLTDLQLSTFDLIKTAIR